MYSLYKVQFPEKYRDEKTCSKAMTVDWHSLMEMQYECSNIHQDHSNITRGIKEQNSMTWGTVLVDNKSRHRMTTWGLTTVNGQEI
jgi:hypothetical protein